jgi:hypothetical protein
MGSLHGLRTPNHSGLLKRPYAALHFVTRHCDVHRVRLIPPDLCALPLERLNKLHKVVIPAQAGIRYYQYIFWMPDTVTVQHDKRTKEDS